MRCADFMEFFQEDKWRGPVTLILTGGTEIKVGSYQDIKIGPIEKLGKTEVNRERFLDIKVKGPGEWYRIDIDEIAAIRAPL